jgi:hypothetical protein
MLMAVAKPDRYCRRGLLCFSLAATMLAGCESRARSGPGTHTDQHGAASALSWDFDDCSAGQLPRGWSIHETKPTVRPATWSVTVDASAPSGERVLALTETLNERRTFNLAIADETRFADLDLSVRVKGVKGEIDQGGGPIWRCQDENNYYICRVNPLENNYRVYKVIDGKRKQLDSADVELEAGRWYTLRVTMTGSHITCYLDGRELLHAEDNTLAEPGMIGFWTKADAVTSFDDLTARSIGR